MKSTIVLSIFLALSLCSCMGRQEHQGENQYHGDSLKYEAAYGEAIPGHTTFPEAEKQGFFDRFNTTSPKTHTFRDARTGLVVQTSDYPSDWKVISKPLYTFDQKLPNFLVQVEGPNNLKHFNTPFKFYFTFSNPQMNQYVSSPMNQMLRPIVGNQQIHQEEVAPRMQRSGFTYVGTKAMPREEAYARKILKDKGTGQEQLEIVNTEWKSETGQRALATIVKVALQQPISQQDYVMVWFYGVAYTFVDGRHFEQTLDDLYASATSTKFNPQWEQYVTQLAQQRQREQARKSAMDHQNRMNARWASFNAHQQKMKGIWAAQDANHASFMNRNFGPGSDIGQKQFVNMINEQETVYNPLTGKNYQVNAGSTEYWMDSEGNYIQNNDLFYTPNGDINLNNREWVKVQKAF